MAEDTLDDTAMGRRPVPRGAGSVDARVGRGATMSMAPPSAIPFASQTRLS